MDEVDRANEHAQYLLEAALRNRKRFDTHPTGKCWNCQEPLPDPMRFCNMDCVLDYEKREDLETRTRA